MECYFEDIKRKKTPLFPHHFDGILAVFKVEFLFLFQEGRPPLYITYVMMLLPAVSITQTERDGMYSARWRTERGKKRRGLFFYYFRGLQSGWSAPTTRRGGAYIYVCTFFSSSSSFLIVALPSVHVRLTVRLSERYKSQ